MDVKKAALEMAQEQTAPITTDMREAVRRIKTAGLKPSKAGAETDTGSVAQLGSQVPSF